MDSQLTPARCISTCQSAGFRYAGVQFSTQCFCGNTIGYKKRPEIECNNLCPGDYGKKCGGPWRSNIYSAAAP